MAPLPCARCVVVHTIAGKELELCAGARDTVGDLKRGIAERWKVPPLCQSLVLGAVALRDSQEVSALGADGAAAAAPLNATLVVSCVEACRCLGALGADGSGARRRREAVEALLWGCRAGAGSEGGAVAALATSVVQDESWEVRRAAALALPQVAQRGDARAIAALSACLKHGRKGQWRERREEVRKAAVQALASVAQSGDERVASAMATCLLDGADVRTAAVEALACLAQDGDELVVADLSERMKDQDERVRLAAQDVLARVAEAGDQRAVAAACARLQDDMYVVRRQATLALGRGWERRATRAAAAAAH